jgi:hypothetical protein
VFVDAVGDQETLIRLEGCRQIVLEDISPFSSFLAAFSLLHTTPSQSSRKSALKEFCRLLKISAIGQVAVDLRLLTGDHNCKSAKEKLRDGSKEKRWIQESCDH